MSKPLKCMLFWDRTHWFRHTGWSQHLMRIKRPCSMNCKQFDSKLTTMTSWLLCNKVQTCLDLHSCSVWYVHWYTYEYLWFVCWLLQCQDVWYLSFFCWVDVFSMTVMNWTPDAKKLEVPLLWSFWMWENTRWPWPVTRLFLPGERVEGLMRSNFFKKYCMVYDDVLNYACFNNVL